MSPLNWIRERQRRKETERRIQVRQSKRRVERLINQKQKRGEELRQYALRAIRLRDEAQFRKCVAMILAGERQINQFERWILAFDVFENQRNDMDAMAEMLKGYESLAQSMQSYKNQVDLSKIQQQIDISIDNAAEMDDILDQFTMMSDEMLDNMAGSDTDTEQEQLMAELRAEAGLAVEGSSDEGEGVPTLEEIDRMLRGVGKELGQE